jgi:hypothetical protein
LWLWLAVISMDVVTPILHPAIRSALLDSLDEPRLVDTRPPRRTRSLSVRRRRVDR